jgi:hypothetical protein
MWASPPRTPTGTPNPVAAIPRRSPVSQVALLLRGDGRTAAAAQGDREALGTHTRSPAQPGHMGSVAAVGAVGNPPCPREWYRHQDPNIAIMLGENDTRIDLVCHFR